MRNLQSGEILGAYRIVRFLGEGGMGRVYEAEHVGLRIRRALKVFSTESEHGDFLRKRFAAEGRMLADLRHPRLVRVYDFAVDEPTGTPYFAMDLVVSPTGEPQTLEDACRAGVDETQVVGWFRDICEGLRHIHSVGVVHRDVSLDNILIDGDGRAVISDFGIAKIVGEDYRRKIDVTLTIPQTPGETFRWGKGLYQAPELKAGGEASPASDAYAVGVLLFRLLSGSWYTPETRLNDALAGMDYNWSEVICRLCAKAPQARLGDGDIVAIAGLLRKTAVPSRLHWRRFGLVVLVVLATVALGLAVVSAIGLRETPEALPAVPRQTAPGPSKGMSAHSPVYRVVDVTNYVRETVYQIVSVTNAVSPGVSSPGKRVDDAQ